jgi:hypothetical protein
VNAKYIVAKGWHGGEARGRFSTAVHTLRLASQALRPFRTLLRASPGYLERQSTFPLISGGRLFAGRCENMPKAAALDERRQQSPSL